MRPRIRRLIHVVIVGLLTFEATIAWSLEPYRWQRTGQTLAARSRVDVVAQGASDFFQQDPGPTNSGFIATMANAEISRPALGGGGGGGGDSGFQGPFTLDGADGDDADPVAGADGAPGDQYAGKGGQPGDDGQATASGTTLCIDETNEDFSTALSYSWIHNQWGDLTLQGAAGGGGGGGGSGGVFGDPAVPEYFPGGSGGDGGNGESASGSVTSTQISAVNVTAQWVVRPDFMGMPPSPPEPHVCNVLLDMGWISAPNPDWVNAGGRVWSRNINLFITTSRGTAVQVTGGPDGPITLLSVDDLGNPYFKVSSDELDSDTGSFGIGPGEIGQTIVLPGDTAQILVPTNTPISSALAGNMLALEGLGGEGGTGGMDIGGAPGQDGGDGIPSGGMAEGGNGGDGGIDDLIDLNGDFIRDAPVGGGGRRGKGGAGGFYDEHKDGIYDGIVTLEVV